MAHAGKLYPVAFRRDLNLDVIDNKRYYPRNWYCTFGVILGTWGSTLAGLRCEDIQEATPVAGEYARWQGGPYVHNGRTFSIRLALEPFTSAEFVLSGIVFDFVHGNLGDVRNFFDRRDQYNQFQLGGYDLFHYPVPSLYLPAIGQGMSLNATRWAEYNILHP